MPRIANLNPDAAAQLDTLYDSLVLQPRRDRLNAQLASTALQTTSKRHQIRRREAQRRHAKRPPVTLA